MIDFLDKVSKPYWVNKEKNKETETNTQQKKEKKSHDKQIC